MTTTSDSSQVPSAAETPRRKDRLWLVILAAALWGTDGLLRVPLVSDLAPSTIVFVEHAIICVLILPWLPSALGERVTARFPLFLVPILVGAWLLSFPDPLGIELSQAQAALLAIGAAILWAGGTVLGRYAATAMATPQVTMLRFFFGLIASFMIVLILGDPLLPAAADIPGLVLLALIPGLLALLLYYRGLAGTAASRATLGELAFPLTAAFIGVTLLDGSLDGSQWIGFVLLLGSVTALALHERRARTPAITAPPLQPAASR